jgi:hypothetical protein
MRRASILLALLLLLVASAAGVQTPIPPATPGSSGTLMEVTLDELAPGSIAAVGMVRTTWEPGGSLRTSTGSGPAVHFVESGAISVRADGDAQVSVVAGGSAEAAATQAGTPGTEITVEAGSAFVLPPGATAEIRNAGESPATTLGLLAAGDATTEAETGVTHAVLAQQKAELPEAPVRVILARVTIAPGDQLELPTEPAQAVYVTVERGQAFLLSGQGINRGPEPMEVYLLTFAGGAAMTASPGTS